MTYDAIIAGGGPAGASCAAFCAREGLRVLVLERAVFPREKVCGDCLNPECWPVFERLGVADKVRALPHTHLRTIEFISLHGRRVQLPLPDGLRGEIAVKRSLLDALLLENAARAGAEIKQPAAVTQVRRLPGIATEEPAGASRFAVQAQDAEPVGARFLVAADGRNSLVARLTGLASDRPARTATASSPNRVGLQTHIPCPADFGPTVQMRWFADGYGGLAPVGGGELNISLAGPNRALAGLKQWAVAEFAIAAGTAWRTIAPLDRWTARAAASTDGVFLLGDAARVVEPFTGEGIYYALRSGELAAQAIIRAIRQDCPGSSAALEYQAAHARMYRGRLWVNRLARAAVLQPRLASVAVEAACWQPGILRHLTRKVVAG
jgi:geranylgeranyl reductase family protein